jgi:hypothetical protein
MSIKDAHQGRSHFEAEKQKRKLYEIGVLLLDTRDAKYTENEFSTVIIFNYTEKPLKAPLEMMLLGFVELDEFLGLDVNALYELFVLRYKRYITRLKKPKVKK